MRKFVEFAFMASLFLGAFGCSAETTANAATRPAARDVEVPSRTLLKVSLVDALNSDTSSAGDIFLAILAEPVVVNGITVLEEGTILSGCVLDSVASNPANGRASIRFALTGITQGDRLFPITTNTFAATSAFSGKRNTEIIAGRDGPAADIGAGGGVLIARHGGTGFAFAAKGREIHYGPETRLNFTLTKSVQLRLSASASPVISTSLSN